MIRSTAALALFCLSMFCPARAAADALPIIEKAFEAAQANEAIVRSYVFHERIEERRLNKKGEQKRLESTTHDVTLLDGSEYRRLIAKDDEPLDEKAAAKEQRKLEKKIEKMRNETPKQREKRLAKIEKERDEEDEFLEEITRAFDFRLAGEEEIDGLVAHVISAEPKPGYEPSSREAKVLTQLRATLWISKDDHGWVKAEMETLGDTKWGIMLKLHEGAQIRLKQRRLNDEVWLPDN